MNGKYGADDYRSSVPVVLLDSENDHPLNLIRQIEKQCSGANCVVVRTPTTDISKHLPELSAQPLHDGAIAHPEAVYVVSPEHYFQVQGGVFRLYKPERVYDAGPGRYAPGRAERREDRLPLEAVARASDDAMIGMSLDGIVNRWNQGATQMYGYAADEMIGRNAEILCRREDLSRWYELLEKLRQGESVTVGDCRRLSRDGEILIVSATASPITDENGDVAGVSLVEHDVSERKEIEQGLRRYSRELEEANRDLETFSYSVSHDLRAPLRAIDGFSRIVLEDYAEALDEDGKQLLQGIHGNAVKMAQLIDDLLAFSRIGRQEMETAPVDMGKLAAEVVQESLHDTDGISAIKIGELPPAQGDRSMLRVVLFNLITNALKYSSTQEHPRVDIGGESHSPGRVVYFVRDNGVGFDMRDAHRLFRVFQRLHDGREFQGTGLGLAIVSRVVTRHDGSVWAESEPDNGATFYFSLPCAK